MNESEERLNKKLSKLKEEAENVNIISKEDYKMLNKIKSNCEVFKKDSINLS